MDVVNTTAHTVSDPFKPAPTNWVRLGSLALWALVLTGCATTTPYRPSEDLPVPNVAGGAVWVTGDAPFEILDVCRELKTKGMTPILDRDAFQRKGTMYNLGSFLEKGARLYETGSLSAQKARVVIEIDSKVVVGPTYSSQGPSGPGGSVLASKFTMTCRYEGSVLWTRTVQPVFTATFQGNESPASVAGTRMQDMIKHLTPQAPSR